MTASIQWNFLDNFGAGNGGSTAYVSSLMSYPNIQYDAVLGKNAVQLRGSYAAEGYYLRNIGYDGSPPAAGTFGFRFYIPGPNSTQMYAEFRDYNLTKNLSVIIDCESLIISIADSTGAIKYSTPYPLLSFGTSYYIEINASASRSSGSVILKINETEITSQINLNTDTNNTGGFRYVGWGCPGSADDINFAYVTDAGFIDTTISGNPQFYGDNNVQYLAPVANGATVNFTPNGLPDNWQNLANIPPNSTDFNSSTTVGATDEVIIGNLSVLTESIGGIFVVSGAKNTSGGLHTYSNQWSGAGGSTYGSGSAITLTSGYLTHGGSPATDPNTGAAWIVAGVNGMKIGYTLAT